MRGTKIVLKIKGKQTKKALNIYQENIFFSKIKFNFTISFTYVSTMLNFVINIRKNKTNVKNMQ